MSWPGNLKRSHDQGWLQPQPKKSSKLSQALTPSQSPSLNISLRPSQRPTKRPEQVPRSNPKQPPEPPPLRLLQAIHYEQDFGDFELEEEKLGLGDQEESVLDQEQEKDADPAPLQAKHLSKMPAPSSRWWEGDGLVGPQIWRCRQTGRTMKYLAARVAQKRDPPCNGEEPVLLYLAGLGDAGNHGNPNVIRKRYHHLLSLQLKPFLFLVPLREKEHWWVIEGCDTSYGHLGNLMPDRVTLLANLVKELAGKRPLIGIGFSAGAYCLTELLGHGRPSFSAIALGGLHGHGQPDMDGVPKKRRSEGICEKFGNWLERLRKHSGVEGGIFAMHTEDDEWSPKRYAKQALCILGARNAELGFDRVRFTICPDGKGHKYEDEAIWTADIFKDLKLIKPKPRGSLAEQFKDQQNTKTPSIIHGASSCWLPGEDHDDILDSDEEPWDESEDEVSLADEEDHSEDEPKATGTDDASVNIVELADENSAVFRKDDEDTSDVWRHSSALDIEVLSVRVKRDFIEMPGESPDWAVRAAEIFKEHGFVVLLEALAESKAAKVLADCRSAARKIVPEAPGMMNGNRHGGARYSFGVASTSRSMLHIPSFAKYLLDNRAVLSTLRAIACLRQEEGAKTDFKCVSAGGDFVLAGERRFQAMHNDLGTLARTSNVHLPPPFVAANFCVAEITGENGPMRIVPGTQLDQGHWDQCDAGEPSVWRRYRLFPLPAGSVILRDVRTLHGGSPNLSNRARFLPAVEFASTQFLATARGRQYICQNCLPRSLSKSLRPQAQRVVHHELLADAEVNPTFKVGMRRPMQQEASLQHVR